MSRHPSSALRRAGLAPLALLLAAGLGACSATNPITTAVEYSASDGVRAQVGDVSLGNLLVLSRAEGAAGTLVGHVTNDSADAVQVGFGVDGADDGPAVTVEPGDTALLGAEDGEEVTLDAVPVAPGAYLTLAVTIEGGASTTVEVPVLDGTLPEYADLVPEAD